MAHSARCYWLAAAVVFCAAKWAVAAPDEPIAEPDAVPLEQWIEQLGDDDFYARERAQKQIAELGIDAFDALSEAAESTDIEIASRARYLIRLIQIDWTTDDDPPAVRRLLADYNEREAPARERRIGMLAELPDVAGLEALCRLVRFERSQVLSKLAAVTMLERMSTDEAWRLRAAEVPALLEVSRRPAARWLRTYIASWDDPAAAVDAWRQVVDEEHVALQRQHDESRADVVLALLELQVRLLDRLERHDEAIETTRRIIVMTPPSISGVTELLEWIIDRGAWSLLDEIETQFANVMSMDEYLVYLAAEARLLAGEDEAAEKLAARAIDFHAEDWRQHVVVGAKLRQRGLTEWAEREFRCAIGIEKPEDGVANIAESQLAELLHDQERDDEAAAVYETAVADVDAVIAAQQFRDEQRQTINEQRNFMLARSHFFRACAAGRRGDVAAQRERLDAAVTLEPLDADVLIGLYHLPAPYDDRKAQVVEFIERAADHFRQVITQGPDNPTPYNQLAWLISNTEGDFDEAIRLSRKSLELANDLATNRPSFTAGYLDTLGRCYYARGDYANAVKYQRQAVKLEPHTLQMTRQLELFEQALAEAAAETN